MQDRDQIGTVHRHIARAPAAQRGIAQRYLENIARAAAIAQRDRLRSLACRRHSLCDPKLAERAHRVGAQLQACADLVQPIGALGHADLVPLARQRQRGGKPGYASADDQDAHEGLFVARMIAV